MSADQMTACSPDVALTSSRQITANEDGTFTLQPGRYVVMNGEYEDHLYHPANHYFFVEGMYQPGQAILHSAVIGREQGGDHMNAKPTQPQELLLLPIGMDRFGKPRTIQFGEHGMVCDAMIAISPTDARTPRPHLYSRHADREAMLSFDRPVVVSLSGRTLAIGDEKYDLDHPGYFFFDGFDPMVIDLGEPGLADVVIGMTTFLPMENNGTEWYHPGETEGLIEALTALGTPAALALRGSCGGHDLHYSRAPAAAPRPGKTKSSKASRTR